MNLRTKALMVCAVLWPLAANAQEPCAYQIDRTGTLCYPTGEIFVDVAASFGGIRTREGGMSARSYPLYRAHGAFAHSATNSAATPSIILAHQKLASDGWVDRTYNKKGERCCDAGKDCFSLGPERIEHVPGGVNITLDDGRKIFVRGEDIMPSEDGKWWLCYWNNQIKCVFSPYSGS